MQIAFNYFNKKIILHMPCAQLIVCWVLQKIIKFKKKFKKIEEKICKK